MCLSRVWLSARVPRCVCVSVSRCGSPTWLAGAADWLPGTGAPPTNARRPGLGITLIWCPTVLCGGRLVTFMDGPSVFCRLFLAYSLRRWPQMLTRRPIPNTRAPALLAISISYMMLLWSHYAWCLWKLLHFILLFFPQAYHHLLFPLFFASFVLFVCLIYFFFVLFFSCICIFDLYYDLCVHSFLIFLE